MRGGRTLIPALIAALASTLAVPEAPPPGPPSVLLITLDTTRADHLGPYGAAHAATPTIDRLSRDGVRFDLALSPAPLTVPSHASLLTGLVPRRHGARDNALYPLGDDVPTVAERLRTCGYDTAAAVSSFVLDRRVGLARGFRVYDDTVRVGARTELAHEERAAGPTADRAVALAAELTPPFLLWTHFYDPHLPYVPPDPYRTRFAASPYDGEIAYVDAELSRVVQAARARDPRTVVIVAGDHGESLGEHGEAGHGVFVYQATQRVPLIVAGPGVARGRAVAAAVGLVDLAPTILELASCPPLPGIDGRSLLPWLGSEAALLDWSRGYEMESVYPQVAYGWAPLAAWVEDGTKLIEAPRRELYDLVRDPHETRDRAVERRSEADRLGRVLEDRVATGGPLRPATTDPGAAERRRRLATLGYVGPSGGAAASDRAPIDPKVGIAWLADLDSGRAALALGRPAQAVAPLERLLARNRDNVPALLTLSQARIALGQPDRALPLLDAAERLSPDDDLVWFHRANALAAQGAPAAATAYDRVHTLNPRRAEAWLNHASYHVKRRDLDAAYDVVRRAQDAGVRDPGLAVERGVLEAFRRRPDAARAAFLEALELDPREPDALDGLAKLAERGGNPAEAVVWLEQLLAVRPTAANRARLEAARAGAPR